MKNSVKCLGECSPKWVKFNYHQQCSISRRWSSLQCNRHDWIKTLRNSYSYHNWSRAETTRVKRLRLLSIQIRFTLQQSLLYFSFSKPLFWNPSRKQNLNLRLSNRGFIQLDSWTIYYKTSCWANCLGCFQVVSSGLNWQVCLRFHLYGHTCRFVNPSTKNRKCM